ALSKQQPTTNPSPESANPLVAAQPSGDPALGSLLVDNAPNARELGLYVHVPFCAKRCGYCSFNTAPLEDGAMGRYLEALRRGIAPLWAPPGAAGIRPGAGFLVV